MQTIFPTILNARPATLFYIFLVFFHFYKQLNYRNRPISMLHLQNAHIERRNLVVLVMPGAMPGSLIVEGRRITDTITTCPSVRPDFGPFRRGRSRGYADVFGLQNGRLSRAVAQV